MKRIGYALVLVGGLPSLILPVIHNLSDYKLNVVLPYIVLANFVLGAGTLLLFADLARTFMAERKERLSKKEKMEIK